MIAKVGLPNGKTRPFSRLVANEGLLISKTLKIARSLTGFFFSKFEMIVTELLMLLDTDFCYFGLRC